MRAGRLVSLLLFLQQQGRTTAAELARELEVSERTVLRDIEELSGAGVPVYATRGPGGGFQLLEGYKTSLADPSTWQSERQRSARSARCSIRISPEGRRLTAVLGRLQPLRVRGPVPSDERGWVEASFRLRSPEAAIIDLMALSPHVVVLAPKSLREDLIARLELALDEHRSASS